MLPKGSRQRTPEEKAARRCHARVTVWRAIHEAHASREHVVVQWWDRSYNGHITEIDDDGFRVHNYEDGGAWCGWDGATEVREPWWDVEATLNWMYSQPCPGCVAVAKRRSAA